MTRRAIVPVDWVALARLLGERDASRVRTSDEGRDVDAPASEVDFALGDAEMEEPLAECRADRVAGAAPGCSAAPVRPSPAVTGRRLDRDPRVEPLGGGPDDDRAAAAGERELAEPCPAEGGAGEEEPGRRVGGVTRGVDTVGVLIDGVVTLGVVTRGVVIGPAVTDGTVAVGTLTDGMETVGTDTARLAAEAVGTPPAATGVTPTDNAPQTARTICRQRLTG